MTNKELQQILLFLREQAANNPYWLFLYDWDIIGEDPNYISIRPTFEEIKILLLRSQFPPIGKN